MRRRQSDDPACSFLLSATRLYSPQVLAAAVSLARFPLNDALPLRGSARSSSCGSTLDIGLALDAGGHVERIGIAAQACAIGQAAASVFVQGAAGSDHAEIAAAAAGMRAWLSGEGGRPDWPDIELIEPARDYPARHAAIMLAWDAALRALEDGSDETDNYGC